MQPIWVRISHSRLLKNSTTSEKKSLKQKVLHDNFDDPLADFDDQLACILESCAWRVNLRGLRVPAPAGRVG